MTWDELLSYCLAKPGAWPDEPWAGDVVVKVGTRIFAFLGDKSSAGLKCAASREAADEWLARYPGRCRGDALHRPVRVEHAADRRRHPG